MDSFGTIVTFDLAAGLEAGTRFAEALELFELTSSLGSTESLVVAPSMQQPRGFTPEQLAWSDIGRGTVRLSLGIEDAGDLVDDLGQALALL
jgi:O-acetylhomoserine (thiol)-lyase